MTRMTSSTNDILAQHDHLTRRWLGHDFVRKYTSSYPKSRDITVFPKVPPLQLPEFGKARVDAFYSSRDPKYLAFLKDLSADLTAKFGGHPSMPDNFFSLRNISGHYGSPVSAPIRSNAALVAGVKQFRPLTQDEQTVFLKGFDMVWAHPIEAGVHLTRGSSPGLVPEPEGREKAQETIFGTALENSRRICGLYASPSPSALAEATYVFRAAPVSARRHRGQADSWIMGPDGKLIPKPRTAILPDDVDSPDPHPVAVDKTVELPPGFSPGDFCASRQRDVANPTLGANTPLMAVSAQCRLGMYENAPYTYKHSTLEVLQHKISGWSWAAPYDVVNFDQFFQELLFGLQLKRMLYLGFDSLFVGYLTNFAKQPTVMHAMGAGPIDPLFGVSVFNASTWRFARLMSGSGDTDLKGRDYGGGGFVLNFFLAGLIGTGSDCDALYAGKHATLAALILGDDNLGGGTNPRDEEPFRRAVERNPVCQFKEDDRWGGNFIDSRGGRVTATPSPGSIITNMFWKEHNRHIKSNWDIHQGFLDQVAFLAKHPNFGGLMEIIDHQMSKHFGFTLSQLVTGVPSPQSPDSIFRANPRAIHYKLDPREISQPLLEQAVMSFPSSKVASSVEWVFKRLRRNF